MIGAASRVFVHKPRARQFKQKVALLFSFIKVLYRAETKVKERIDGVHWSPILTDLHRTFVREGGF